MQRSSPSPIPSERPRVAVVGAGVVGASIALQLQCAGFASTLLDPRPPGHGASYGNAGLISIDSCIPLALPGLPRKIPGLLFDRTGPLTLRLGHLPRALPWLWKRIRGIGMADVLRCSDAMAALHRGALQGYRDLLGPEHFDALVRGEGQVHVWTRPVSRGDAAVEQQLRERQGVEARWLARGELEELVPGIAADCRHALYFPRNAHTVDPRRLVQTLVGLHARQGGRLLVEQVLKLIPADAGGWRVITDVDNHRFDRVVVANGMGARALTRPLGLKLPLEAERGYHVELSGCTHAPRLPVVHREQGFVATPMAGALRLAGTVEIAAADDPPDERRAEALLRHARSMLPALESDGAARIWMGARPSTPDGLPVIDAVERLPGLVLACGHSHFGLTGAPMTGRLVVQVLAGASPAVPLQPYRLARFH